MCEYIQKALSAKSDSESKKFREEGNKYYAKGFIFDAILHYNKAIAFASTNECLGLAYGNRSAAYFQSGNYQECIDNIKLARANGYPQEKLAKLSHREGKCIEVMEKLQEDPEDDPWKFFKLSYPANEKIPWIIEGLEMRKTQKDGRGIYATRVLKAGDIICVEEVSSLIMLTNDGFWKHCSCCIKTNMLNLLPCTKTASFMFCSTQCREDFYKHADLSSFNFTPFAALLSQIEAAFGGRQKLQEYIRDSKPEDFSFFNLNFADATQTEKHLYICKSLLASKTNLTDIASRIFEPYPDPTTQELLIKIADVYWSTSAQYCHKKFQATPIDPAFVQNKCSIGCVHDGSVFCAFFDHLNHSCVPNVDRVLVDNKMIFFVTRPINPDDQLFVTYAGEFFNDIDQRKELLRIFNITCDCMACVQKLSHTDLKRENFNEPLPIQIQLSDIKSFRDALDMAKKNFSILQCSKFTSMECYNSGYNLHVLLFFPCF